MKLGARLLKTLVLILVGVALAGAAAAALLLPASPFSDWFSTYRTDRDRPAILQSVTSQSRFQGASGAYDVVVDLDKGAKGIGSFFTGRHSLFIASGTVGAYVELGKVRAADITQSADGKAVTIRLPKAELDKPNLDPKRSYLFSQDRGVFTAIGDAFKTESQDELYALAEDKLTKAASQSTLTTLATKNTKDMLARILGASGTKVTFVD